MHKVTVEDISQIVGDVVGDDQLAVRLKEHSVLLGAIPELDSMAVVNLVLGMEEKFGFHVDDDEVDAALFETVGSLREFAQSKLDQTQRTA